MTEKKLAALLAEMSLEEKVMQLVQLPGSAYDDTANITGNELEPVDPRVKQLAGSTLGILSGKTAKRIQQEYMAAHPHHIPLLLMADVIHGYRTVFPCPLGLGATFDPEIVEQAASAQAEEAAADGIQVTFSPMADLVRDARWGRVMESTGEDKVLNGRMAAAMVRGYQGGGALKDEHTVASCVKHYAAYGAADGGRDYNNTELSEHTLREDYLPAYAEGIRAGARMIMSSFNSWNGIPVTGSAFLLKQILRSELGFDGVVISDWDAVGQLIPHGFAEDRKDAACKAFQAGVDIDMSGGAEGPGPESRCGISGPAEKRRKSPAAPGKKDCLHRPPCRQSGTDQHLGHGGGEGTCGQLDGGSRSRLCAHKNGNPHFPGVHPAG